MTMKTGLRFTKPLLILGAFSATVFAALTTMAADTPQPFDVSSNAFPNHGTVPLKYTAYGDNISPELSWTGLPEGTQQIALVMDDPVAPTPEPFSHWVAYNIPATATGLPENLSKETRVTNVPALEGMINGVNGIRQTGYFGPRPPVDGKDHAYHFWVYALDTKLDLPEGLNKQQLQDAIREHIIGVGMLMGHYERKE